VRLSCAEADKYAGPWAQCGGKHYRGPTRCIDGYRCDYQNDYYSQCILEDSPRDCAAHWGQCGGRGYKGPTCCGAGFECVESSEWFHQCLPIHHY
jgi:Fungal cellulose binding domain